MKNKNLTAYKKQKFYFVCFLLCVLSLSFVLFAWSNPFTHSDTFNEKNKFDLLSNKNNNKTTVVAKGLKSSAKLTYNIHHNKKASSKKKETAHKYKNKRKNKNSSKYSSAQNELNEYLTYDVAIEDKDTKNVLNVLLRVNPSTGKLSISGSGLQEYSPILLEINDQKIRSKADWVGMFQDIEADLSMNSKNKALDKKSAKAVQKKMPSIKLVMQGQGWVENSLYQAQSQANHNKDQDQKFAEFLEIQFLNVPGQGGGPTNQGVNEFEANLCFGQTPLSICNRNVLSQAIQDLVNNYVGSLMLMTEQLSSVMLSQAMIIGNMLDAKHQLETQRLHQQKQAQMHKNYYPGEQMCRFGSFMRSIATTESKAQHDKLVLNEIMMGRYLNKEDTSASEGSKMEFLARMEQFKTTYCDAKDNNNALQNFCKLDTSKDNYQKRLNKDVSYTKTFSNPLTLNINFTNERGLQKEIEDEADIIALGKNLYWPNVLGVAELDKEEAYLERRRLAAFQNIAHSSYINQVAHKASSRNVLGQKSGGAHMKSMLREFGMDDIEIEELLGVAPSYYAQMDVLTKKIYQSPNFYTNLYDKPANVERIGASMEAISLMNDRDHYASAIRKEMLLSLLVTEELKKHTEQVRADIISSSGGPL